jgi:hypothetical protein
MRLAGENRLNKANHRPALASSLVVAAVILAACAVPFQAYTISSSNISAIRSTQRNVELGEFIGQQASASCRLRRIGPDGDRTFAQYIRSAFNDELVIAGQPTARERSMVSLKMRDVDVDCGNIWASWTIEADVKIANQLPFTVKVVHEFDGNFIPDIVWQRANVAYVPAVQEFIAAIIANPAYKDEFGIRAATAAVASASAAASAASPASAPASAAAPAAAAPAASAPARASEPEPDPDPDPPQWPTGGGIQA